MAMADHGGKMGCLVMVLLGIAAVYFLFAHNPGGRTTKPPEPYVPTEFAAYSICKDFVLDRLKAPKTAEFASSDDSKVYALGGEEFEVVSFVDAQNAFGANIRTRYLCRVRHTGNRNWHLSKLVFK